MRILTTLIKINYYQVFGVLLVFSLVLFVPLKVDAMYDGYWDCAGGGCNDTPENPQGGDTDTGGKDGGCECFNLPGGGQACNCGGNDIPSIDNMTCEQALEGSSCSSSSCQGKVFYKVTASNPTAPYLNNPDYFLEDDSIMSGGIGDLLSLSQANYTSRYNGMYRAYTYIYVPTPGWYDFGFVANQSLMSSDPNSSDYDCYYCNGPLACTFDNNTDCTKRKASDAHVDGQFSNVFISCEYCYKLPKSCDDTDNIKPACGGTSYVWFSATGEGTESSPYVAVPPASDSAPAETVFENGRFEYDIEHYQDRWKDLQGFYYDWVDPTKLEWHPASTYVSDIPYTNSVWSHGSVSDAKYFKKHMIYIHPQDGYAQLDITLPNYDLPDNPTLTNTNYYSIDHLITTFYTYNNNDDYQPRCIPGPDSLCGPQSIDVYCDDQFVENFVWGDTCTWRDCGFMNNQQKANPDDFSLGGRRCNKVSLRINTDYKVGAKDSGFSIYGIPSASDWPAKPERADTFWNSPKYFSQGWYPLQISAYYSKSLFYDPQILWVKCSSPDTCGVPEKYTVGGANGGDMVPCYPGETGCSLVFGGTGTVSVAKGGSVATTLNLGGAVNPATVSLTSTDPAITATLGTCGVTSCPVTITASEDSSSATAYTVTASATHTDGTSSCSGATLPVVVSGGFWQVKDADVVTMGGISSLVSDTNVFDLAGVGGFPGIPVYGVSSTTNLTSDTVSTKGWMASSAVSGNIYSKYGYDFFLRMLDSKTKEVIEATTIDESALLNTGTPDDMGYTYLVSSDPDGLVVTDVGEITIPADKKIILFVEGGDTTLQKDISITQGGLLVIIAKHNIDIDPAVTELDGVYFAQEDVNTGSEASTSDLALTINGSVAAMGRINLERELSDTSVLPAELFNFRADLLLSLPTVFGSTRMEWRETAP